MIYQEAKDLLELENLLLKLPHKLQIRFVYNCLLSDGDFYRQSKSLQLIAKWLVNENSVSYDELMDSINGEGDTVIYSIVNSIHGGYFDNTYYVANVFRIISQNPGKSFNYYYNDLVNMINNLDELSKLLYGIKL